MAGGADGMLISFDPPGGIGTNALSINSRGAITGYYYLFGNADNRAHGFLRRPGGTFVSFDAPESTGTTPVSINDAGAITGYYFAANGRYFGFVRDPLGKFTSFDPGLNTQPTSINNKGAVTGSRSGAPSGFVRSPEGTITLFDTVLPGRLDQPHEHQRRRGGHRFLRVADAAVSSRRTRGLGAFSVNVCARCGTAKA